MAKLTPATYEKPVRDEAPNPFIDVVQPYTDKGIDTAFAVEFEAKDYKAEKLQIQKAVNAHGFSAREVVTNWDADAEYKGNEAIKATFVIRPKRKARTGSADADAAEGDDAS